MIGLVLSLPQDSLCHIKVLVILCVFIHAVISSRRPLTKEKKNAKAEKGDDRDAVSGPERIIETPSVV